MNNVRDNNDDNRFHLKAKIVDEKTLKGEGSPILRQMCTDEASQVSQTRLCLFHGDNQTYAIFGGEFADKISSDDYNQLFEIIISEEDFYRYSEQIRGNLAKILNT
jgi:hypothetical protein